ncbi:MAG: DUF1080 domain-containing protein [Acidobacteriota bacterium]|nr:MAG: DUF1080 domain-containing protein [Acidobacteriota bacterium]
MRRTIINWGSMLFLLLGLMTGCGQEDGWVEMFDGASLNGWKAAESPESFQVVDGTIVAGGPRGHLYYVGKDGAATFKNFEFTAEVKTTPGSNSGIYFHTAFQEEGWPARGYECQVLNSNRPVPDGEYVEHKMTGSLYAIRNVWKPIVPDNEWFRYHILVQGKTVQIRINDLLVVDYTESESPPRLDEMQERLISSGTFALQGHDPDSSVSYRNLRVRRLPDDSPSLGVPQPDLELERHLIELSGRNFPLIDLHGHLKGDLTLDQVLERARLYGFTYGLAVNCGLFMTYPDEGALREFLMEYQRNPLTYLAMQAEGREWTEIFSEKIREEFDYVFSDSMTWTNDDGKRMRLWIPEETEVGDPEKFMQMFVDRTVGILENEPIDIYVNPTYLPDSIASQYDELWTEERMDRVIQALVENEIALEINDRRRIPSPAFLKRAKAAGVKFTFGTNNGGADDLGHLAYCLEMTEELGLESSDIWMPEVR